METQFWMVCAGVFGIMVVIGLIASDNNDDDDNDDGEPRKMNVWLD